MNTIQWHRLSTARLQRERELLTTIPYFTLERTRLTPTSDFTATGTLHYIGRRSSKQHTLRVRLEYPRTFPRESPRVYDHESVLKPDPNGHLLSTHELCLTLPERGEFSTGADHLTREVLDAALLWFHKRHLYDKNGTWPGLAERHGIFAIIDLLIERGVIPDEHTIIEWIMTHALTQAGHLTTPDRYAPCPCGSGKRVRFCHGNELDPIYKRLERMPRAAHVTTALGNKDGEPHHGQRY